MMSKRKQASIYCIQSLLKAALLTLIIIVVPSLAIADKNKSISKQQTSKEKYKIASQFFQKSEYKKAARSFMYLVENSEGHIRRDSLEMLGVSYEQDKRIAQAKSTYEQYIKKYKKGESTDRVKQRLAHLIESKLVAKVPRVYNVKNRRPRIVTRHKTSVMQYLFMSNNNFNKDHYKTDQTLLYSYLNSDWRKRDVDQEFRANLSARYANNFHSNENGPIDIKDAFLSYKSANLGRKLKLGRQKGHDFGVSNRFDGVSGGSNLFYGISGNLAYGSPVNYLVRDSINTKESFYAANLSFVSPNDKLEVESYLIKRQNQGYTNRKAIGSSFRWQDKIVKLFVAADIDLNYKTHNLLQVQTEYQYKKNKLYLHYDSRRNPFLETGTALLLITDLEDMDELRNLYTDEQIEQLTLDLTGGSVSYRTGIQHSFNKQLSINSEVILAEYLLNYVNSAGDLQSNSEKTVTLNFRLVAQRYTRLNEINILNVRLINSNRYDRLVLQATNRIRPVRKLQLSTKLRVSFRDSDSGEKQKIIYPAINLKYYFGKKTEITAELGRSWYLYTANSNNSDFQRNYFNAGYIMRF